MRTYSPKLTDLKREWFVVDVQGKVLGKIAAKIANILRGKNKTIFSPHIDCGDFVIIINARKIRLTGKKAERKDGKLYHYHTRYPGGLKTTTAGKLLDEKPEKILQHAIAGMIPHTKLKKDILKKLKIYPDAEHKHEAQEPKPLSL